MVKVTYVISHINKSVAFEWIAELIDKEKIELNFVLLNNGNTELEKYLLNHGFLVKKINYKNKFDIPKALIYTILFLIKHKPNIVHTHLFDANIVGLIAAWICRIKKRIHTRHHSSYHHDYFPKAIKYDKLCNKLSTDIIAITEIVAEILEKKEFVPKYKIQTIHHGFKLNKFTDIPLNEKLELKQKYQTEGFYPVIGVISRYIDWKGIQYIIPAFKQLLIEFPKAKLILANAHGDYQSHIKEMLKEIPVANYTEIIFENNSFALYSLFDVFVHVPTDKYSEAFGQVYIESLASSVPSVVTLSGIANDFMIDRHNTLVCEYKDSTSVFKNINTILNDNSLKEKLIYNGRMDVQKLFPISKMIKDLEILYLQ